MAEKHASNSGLSWVTVAFIGGVALNADRVPLWVPVAALTFVAWRWLATTRPLWLPRTLTRGVLALILVGGVLIRFHTLNGLTAGTALLVLMGSIKLLETRTERDQLIVIGAALFLLLAACLDRQSLLRTPLYLVQAWVCCAALAVVAHGPAGSFHGRAALKLAARSLAFATPLAVVLFVFFPRLPGAFWSIPKSEEAVTGLSDVMSPGSITNLTNSYDVAFRAWFDAAPPPPQLPRLKRS